jgi:cytochrome c peroxidase
VAFYAERDSDPGKWYSRGPDGTVLRFDDLPAKYVSNVTMELPFGPRRVLSDGDVDDIVAFLHTLTDGYGTNGYTTDGHGTDGYGGAGGPER